MRCPSQDESFCIRPYPPRHIDENMDWPPKSDPFIAPNGFELFDLGLDVRESGQKCRVIQNWDLHMKHKVGELRASRATKALP